MLNIEKFRNNFKITIQGGLKTVHEWSEDGEGGYCFSSGMEYYGKSFDVDESHIKDIGKKVIESINNSNYSNMEESDFVIIDNRLSWNQIEDNECNILEIQEEIKAEGKTYICDYDVFISINGIELEEEDLRELFHDAQ